jgi:hypothetical protein
MRFVTTFNLSAPTHSHQSLPLIQNCKIFVPGICPRALTSMKALIRWTG